MSKSPTIAGHSSALRKGRISEAYGCYSITKVVQHREPVLASAEVAGILLNSWQYLRSQGRIKLFSFCIMPDHYHLAFCLMPNGNLSMVLESTSKFTSKQINTLFKRKGRFWQEGFRDRRCRTTDELRDHCSYIEHNPVRAGLVRSAADWPYSSAAIKNHIFLDKEWWP